MFITAIKGFRSLDVNSKRMPRGVFFVFYFIALIHLLGRARASILRSLDPSVRSMRTSSVLLIPYMLVPSPNY